MNWFRAIQLGLFLGLALWGWMEHRNAIGWANAYTAAVAAGAAAEQAQIGRNLAQEARWAQGKAQADETHQAKLDRLQRAANRLIADAAGGVRPVCPGALGRSDPVPAPDGPGVPESAPAAYPVTVQLTPADVQACAANAAYASSAYEWAASLAEQ